MWEILFLSKSWLMWPEYQHRTSQGGAHFSPYGGAGWGEACGWVGSSQMEGSQACNSRWTWVGMPSPFSGSGVNREGLSVIFWSQLEVTPWRSAAKTTEHRQVRRAAKPSELEASVHAGTQPGLTLCSQLALRWFLLAVLWMGLRSVHERGQLCHSATTLALALGDLFWELGAIWQDTLFSCVSTLPSKTWKLSSVPHKPCKAQNRLWKHLKDVGEIWHLELGYENSQRKEYWCWVPCLKDSTLYRKASSTSCKQASLHQFQQLPTSLLSQRMGNFILHFTNCSKYHAFGHNWKVLMEYKMT